MYRVTRCVAWWSVHRGRDDGQRPAMTPRWCICSPDSFRRRNAEAGRGGEGEDTITGAR